MRGKRVIAVLVCVVMVLGMMPYGFAAVNITVVPNNPVLDANNETLIELTITNLSGVDINIKQVLPRYSGIVVAHEPVEYVPDIANGVLSKNTTVKASIKVTLINNLTDRLYHSVPFDIIYTHGSPDEVVSSHSLKVQVYKADSPSTEPPTTSPTDDGSDSFPDPSASPEPIDEQAPALLMISPTGEDGSAVTAPAGNGGDSIRVRVPIMNRGTRSFDAIASRIIVTPQISATIDSFPFDVEAIDYSRSLPDMRPGQVNEVVYHFKISKEVKSGVKEVKFNCVYFNHQKQTYETATLSVFVTVVKGKEDEDGGYKDGDELLVTQPKIIVESSTLALDEPQPDDEEGRLYAGEPFTLTMSLRNTSKEEAIKNIQVTLSNEGNIIIPANNASNSFYIDRIEPGQSLERVVKLQSTPDAEPKSQTLKVIFAYESSKTLKGYEESQDIAVPIAQRVRVRVNDPMIYGDAYMDQPINVSISMMNMSKSTLYYCAIDVEGEGLRMEEPFYYGNVSGGGQMSGDFNIIPSVAGDITGKVIITFEDAYNKQTRLEKEFNLFVVDTGGMGGMGDEDMFFPGDMGDMMGGMEQPNEGMKLWVIIALAGGVVLLGVGLIVMLRRKRRRRELTESL